MFRRVLVSHARRRSAGPILLELPVLPAERDQIKADAENAADRYLLSGGAPQECPWPRGTRRHVFWMSFFLEATTCDAFDTATVCHALAQAPL